MAKQHGASTTEIVAIAIVSTVLTVILNKLGVVDAVHNVVRKVVQ